jgi:hypothetical protein
MPGLSRDTAPQVLETESMVIRSGPLGDHVAAFERFEEETRTDGLFDGLPGDRCSCPHWGYVFAGSITFRYADREETFVAGDAFYAPAGHLTTIAAGTEFLELSPADEHARAGEILRRNLGR